MFRHEYVNSAIAEIQKRLDKRFVLMTAEERVTILRWLDDWILEKEEEAARHLESLGKR